MHEWGRDLDEIVEGALCPVRAERLPGLRPQILALTRNRVFTLLTPLLLFLRQFLRASVCDRSSAAHCLHLAGTPCRNRPPACIIQQTEYDYAFVRVVRDVSHAAKSYTP
jgi:hypothetical protein